MSKKRTSRVSLADDGTVSTKGPDGQDLTVEGNLKGVWPIES